MGALREQQARRRVSEVVETGTLAQTGLLKERFIKLSRFTGVLIVEWNTSPVLCYKGPSLERSSSCATR
jgi:hypothetical protein